MRLIECANREFTAPVKETGLLILSLNRRMAAVEQSLKTLALAIESARTAIAQTDDLVERVVDALELQPREAP